MSDNDNLEDRIRERAFEIYIEEGQPFGKEQEHWERAKREIEKKDREGAFNGRPNTGL